MPFAFCSSSATCSSSSKNKQAHLHLPGKKMEIDKAIEMEKIALKFIVFVQFAVSHILQVCVCFYLRKLRSIFSPGNQSLALKSSQATCIKTAKLKSRAQSCDFIFCANVFVHG